jgi:DNA-directed RNA polymerase specialized sigma24 family protein
MEEDIIWIDLRAACLKLTERQQTAVYLYLMGYTQAEIGGMMDCNQQAAGKHLRAAVRNLGQILAYR